MSVAQDFLDLFMHKRQGHIGKYVYEHRPDIYDQILHQDTYYPFVTESRLLKEYSTTIAQQLGHIDYVLELGPGSSRPIQHKTIPLLSEIVKTNISPTYAALDHTKFYADQACLIVKDALPFLKTQGYHVDFSNSESFTTIKDLKGRKLYICFGQPIFANHDRQAAKDILTNIAQVMDTDDLFLMGIDFTRDLEKIESAYNTRLGSNLLLNAFYYFQETLRPNGFSIDLFKHHYHWNTDQTRVELSMVATQDQKFEFENQTISIKSGQKFTLMYSCKPNLSMIIDMLKDLGLIPMMQDLDQIRDGNYIFLLLKKQNA